MISAVTGELPADMVAWAVMQMMTMPAAGAEAMPGYPVRAAMAGLSHCAATVTMCSWLE